MKVLVAILAIQGTSGMEVKQNGAVVAMSSTLSHGDLTAVLSMQGPNVRV